MNKSFYQFLIFLAGSIVCLYLAFSPVVNIPYINHDSIRYFHKFYNRVNQENPLYRYLKEDGRLVGAEFEELLYKNVNHLSDVSRLRFITIIVAAFSASLLMVAARSAGMGAVPAFCLCVAIFTLPGVQDIIFVPYLYATLAIFLSLLAYFILSNKLMYGLHFIFALVLLEAAFYMYPPSAFFFLVPTMLLVIFNDNWQLLKKISARDILLWLLAAGMYYLTLRVFFYAQVKSTGHDISFTPKLLLIYLTTFLSNGVPQIFNLWNIYYSKALGIFMMVLVTVFITIDFFVTRKIGYKRLVVLAVLFCVFSMIWFLFGGYMPRQFIAAQALALGLVYWSGEWLGNFIKRKNELFVQIWPVFIVCIGLICANRMITTNVLHNYSELMFVRSRLAQFVSSTTKEIHVISLKDDTRGYNGLPKVYDNINSPIVRYEIPDLVRVALKDLADPFELHCIVTYSDYGQPFQTLPNSVVIDMNDLAYISSPQQK